MKDFCNYGLEHWGSDDKGVENTRKFLLGKTSDWRSSFGTVVIILKYFQSG